MTIRCSTRVSGFCPASSITRTRLIFDSDPSICQRSNLRGTASFAHSIGDTANFHRSPSLVFRDFLAELRLCPGTKQQMFLSDKWLSAVSVNPLVECVEVKAQRATTSPCLPTRSTGSVRLERCSLLTLKSSSRAGILQTRKTDRFSKKAQKSSSQDSPTSVSYLLTR